MNLVGEGRIGDWPGWLAEPIFVFWCLNDFCDGESHFCDFSVLVQIGKNNKMIDCLKGLYG
jgi:hypothetical protein